MISRSVRPCVAARMDSTSCTKPASFLAAAPSSAVTLCARLRPLARAASCSISTVRPPMPRAGKFTTRRKLVSSSPFSSSRR